MNLTLDIGNTKAKLAVFEDNQMINNWSIKDFSLNYLRDFFENHSNIKNLGFSNTSSKIEGLESFCKKRNIKCFEIDSKCKLPISIEYSTPETLGSDRIILSVGAAIQYPGEKLIIDLGTCITYDVVLNNKYIGGQISLGLHMRLSALNYYTKNLPKLNFEFSSNFIGKTTKDSILLGVYEGVLLEIEGIIQKYKSRYPNMTIILTGGDIEIFKKSIKNINFINPYLLMEGLNYIIAFNE